MNNGKLYEFARDSFDLCFLAISRALILKAPSTCLKALRVTLPQKPQDEFVYDFLSVFGQSDWTRFRKR